MADSIQFRRGLRSAVKPLPVGMPGFIEDEERLVVGKGDGTNTELPNKADMDNINSQMADIATNIQKYYFIANVGTDTEDWGIALNEALKQNSNIYFPPTMIYKFKTSVIIDKKVIIKGQYSDLNINNMIDVLKFTTGSDGSVIDGFYVNYTNMPNIITSFINILDASKFTIKNITLNNVGGFLYGEHFHESLITNIHLTDYYSHGIWLKSSNDIYLNNFVFQGGFTTETAINGGIHFDDFNEAIMVSNGDVVGGLFSMVTSSSIPNGIWTNPEICKFTNVYFDSAQNGVQLSCLSVTKFIGCWFSNRPNNGLNIEDNCYDLKFIGCEFINNGSHGVKLSDNTSHNIRFIGCSFSGNNTQNNHSSDFYISKDVSDFYIISCDFFKPRLTWNHYSDYSIFIEAGNSDRFVIENNTFGSSKLTSIMDLSTGLNKSIKNTDENGILERYTNFDLFDSFIKAYSSGGGKITGFLNAYSAGITPNNLACWLDGHDFINDTDSIWNDKSGNNLSAKTHNFDYTNTSGSDNNGGVVFDGLKDYCIMPSTEEAYKLQYPCTIIFKLSYVNKNDINMIFTSSNEGGAANGIRIFINTFQTQDRKLNIETGNGTTRYILTSNQTLLDNTEYIIAILINGDNSKIIINGIDDATGVLFNPTNEEKMFLGTLNGLYHINMNLKTLLIYNKILSQTDLMKNYIILK